MRYIVSRIIEATPEVILGPIDRGVGLLEEVYTGLMAPLITRSIPDMTDSFEEFAEGLKVAAVSR